MARPAIYARAYRDGDAQKVRPRADMAREQAAVDWATAAIGGHTWTLVRWPAEVIGYGGFAPGTGVWQGWAVLDETVGPRDWPLLMDCARAVIGQIERSEKLPIVALVRAGWGPGERVLEKLGFTRQTEAPDWPGYRLMARGL